MRDITAILVDYSNQTTLHKALASLNKIRSRLHSVIVLQASDGFLNRMPDVDWHNRIQSLAIRNGDTGKTVRDTIRTIDSSFVLFLISPGYLAVQSANESLQLPPPKAILETSYDLEVRYPLLVRTSLLKKQPIPTSAQLPFKEALFPSWLSGVKDDAKLLQEDLVRQAKKNRSKNTLEKRKLIQKYQSEKTSVNHPSLSIMIAAYNMEAYIETAVMSCLLQNEQPEQILIMDDGSTDNTYQCIQRYHDDQRVKTFHKKNGGKARALNELLPHVTSDFILELDADDWLDADAVTVIKKYLSILPDDAALLYGNLRKWKQLNGDVLFKNLAKGNAIKGRKDLLSYRFPLGPRVYCTSTLKKEGGFPVIAFEDGRLFEDVSVLNRLIKKYPFQYKDFTVYNVREHKESITKQNVADWHQFLRSLE
ncbi:glycosyltransferase family 2 protein [Lentibacillus lipolyticus]|nr:glycosyltransferase family 2 protein [Lentibacillus lipolyticus]